MAPQLEAYTLGVGRGLRLRVHAIVKLVSLLVYVWEGAWVPLWNR